MASGILGGVALPTATATTVYTVPVGKQAAITVNACNRSSTDANSYWLAFTANASAASQDFVEFNATIVPTGVLERTGFVLGANVKVIANASAAGITVMCYGFEETVS